MMGLMSRAKVHVVVPEQVYNCADPHVGPHNRCRHPVALPEGYVQCVGDPGCSVRVPASAVRQPGEALCFWHKDEAAIRESTWQSRYEELMGADE